MFIRVTEIYYDQKGKLVKSPYLVNLELVKYIQFTKDETAVIYFITDTLVNPEKKKETEILHDSIEVVCTDITKFSNKLEELGLLKPLT